MQKNRLSYFLFVAPGLLLYLLIIAYPVLYSLGLSFTDMNPGGRAETGVNFVGLKHYRDMFAHEWFYHALKNNLIVVAISVFGQIPIGLGLAYILYRKLIRGSKGFQNLVFLPQFLSTIVIGILWKRIFSADGPISRMIQWFSGDSQAQFDWMLRPDTVMIPIGIVLIWMYSGFYMIIFLANMQKVDKSILEGAKIDGASELQIFAKIILPLLSGTIIVSSILAIAGSLKGFDLIFAMTTQGLQRNNAMVLPIFMYQVAFQDYSNPVRFAFGAALSNTIVLISVALIVLSNFIGKRLGERL